MPLYIAFPYTRKKKLLENAKIKDNILNSIKITTNAKGKCNMTYARPLHSKWEEGERKRGREM